MRIALAFKSSSPLPPLLSPAVSAATVCRCHASAAWHACCARHAALSASLTSSSSSRSRQPPCASVVEMHVRALLPCSRSCVRARWEVRRRRVMNRHPSRSDARLMSRTCIGSSMQTREWVSSDTVRKKDWRRRRKVQADAGRGPPARAALYFWHHCKNAAGFGSPL